MGLGRVLLCILLPPLAVLDRGCGTILIVTILTLCGWVPGALAAIFLSMTPTQHTTIIHQTPAPVPGPRSAPAVPAPSTRFCARCGAARDPARRFCPQCGLQFPAVAAQPAIAQPQYMGTRVVLVLILGGAALFVLTRAATFPTAAPAPTAPPATVAPVPTRPPATPTVDLPPLVLTQNAERMAGIQALLATQTALAPTPEPPTPAPTVGLEARFQQLVAQTIAAPGHKINTLQVEAFEQPSVPRWEIDVYCDLQDDFLQESTAKRLAFEVHKALWTSGLPVGVVMVWVYAPGGSVNTGGKILVNARAGYTLMHNQGWSGVGPSIWADFLRDHAYNVGDNNEDAVWFH